MKYIMLILLAVIGQLGIALSLTEEEINHDVREVIFGQKRMSEPTPCGLKPGGGKYYVGDVVKSLIPCERCMCTKKGTNCIRPLCGVPKCRKGEEPVQGPLDCCPKCPRKRSVDDDINQANREKRVLDVPSFCGLNSNGVPYAIGDVMPSSDKCKHCVCSRRGEMCMNFLCGVPSCGIGVEPIRGPNDCCPRCPKKRSAIDDMTETAHEEARDVTSYCGLNSNGVPYSIGEAVPSSDPCETCRCTQNGWKCARRMCGMPNCGPGVRPVQGPNDCCPRCPKKRSADDDMTEIVHEEERDEPSYCGLNSNGVPYSIGEAIPSSDPCEKCKCTQNGPKCARRMCGMPNCGRGVSPVQGPNDCCPRCPKKRSADDVCVWTSIPNHYLGGRNLKITKTVSAKYCQDECEQTPNCRSVDYFTSRNDCYLNHQIKDDVKPSIFINKDGFTYYERHCGADATDVATKRHTADKREVEGEE